MPFNFGSHSGRTIDTWRQFLIGMAVLVGVTAAFDGVIARGGGSLASRSMEAFVYGLQVTLVAVACAGVIWLVVRGVRGKDGAPDLPDFVLWNAALLGALLLAVRMFT